MSRLPSWVTWWIGLVLGSWVGMAEGSTIYVRCSCLGPVYLSWDRLGEAMGVSASEAAVIWRAEDWGVMDGIGRRVLHVRDDVRGGVRWLMPEEPKRDAGWVVGLAAGLGGGGRPVSLRERGDGDIGPGVPLRLRSRIETNLIEVAGVPSARVGDGIFWRSMLAGHSVLSRFGLDWLAEEPGHGAGELVMWVSVPGTSGGGVRLEVDGMDLGVARWEGRGLHRLNWDLAAGWSEGEKLHWRWRIEGDRAVVAYVDMCEWIREIRGWKGEEPVELEALASGTARLGWGGRGRAEVFELGKGGEVGGIQMETEGAASGELMWRVEAGRRYWVVGEGHWMEPESVWRSRWDGEDLVGAFADVAIVVPDGWGSAGRALAEVHAREGWRSQWTEIGRLVDGFGAGHREGEVIWRWLRHRSHAGQLPKNLVLVGDGRMDRFGRLGGQSSLMPVWVGAGVEGTKPLETELGDLDGDGWPEVMVGRIPVRSLEEFQDWYGKRLGHGPGIVEAQDAPEVLLVADAADEAGDFPADVRMMALRLEEEYRVTTAIRGELDVEQVRRGVRIGLTEGAGMIQYLGHGGRDRLGAGYLVLEDVKDLPQVKRPPVLVGMTCGIGQFGSASGEGLGEELVRRSAGGAMAVWAATSSIPGLGWRSLGQGWLEAMHRLGRHAPVGEMIRDAIAHHREWGGESVDRYGLVLLGDPVMPLFPGAEEASLRMMSGPKTAGVWELEWVGGEGPFRVESSQQIRDESWEMIYEGMERRLTITPGLEQVARYYRVRTAR